MYGPRIERDSWFGRLLRIARQTGGDSPHAEKMAVSQCLIRGSSVTCTTCLGDEVSGTVVATRDVVSLAVLSKSDSQRMFI